MLWPRQRAAGTARREPLPLRARARGVLTGLPDYKLLPR